MPQLVRVLFPCFMCVFITCSLVELFVLSQIMMVDQEGGCWRCEVCEFDAHEECVRPPGRVHVTVTSRLPLVHLCDVRVVGLCFLCCTVKDESKAPRAAFIAAKLLMSKNESQRREERAERKRVKEETVLAQLQLQRTVKKRCDHTSEREEKHAEPSSGEDDDGSDDDYEVLLLDLYFLFCCLLPSAFSSCSILPSLLSFGLSS